MAWPSWQYRMYILLLSMRAISDEMFTGSVCYMYRSLALLGTLVGPLKTCLLLIDIVQFAAQIKRLLVSRS
jgi:hypothetical protein